MRQCLAGLAMAACLLLVTFPCVAQDEGRIERDVGEAKRFVDQGRPQEAWTHLQRALRDGESILNEQPETLAQLNAFAGIVALDLGKLEEAERLFRRSHALLRRAKGDEHADTLRAARNLAAALAAGGKYAEAEALIAGALAATERRLGSGQTETALLLYDLGSLWRAQGRNAEAETTLRRAVAIRDSIGPPAALAEVLDALGAVLQRQWRLAEAEPLHRRAASLVEGEAGGNSRVVYLSNLAAAIEGQGRLAEAGELYQFVLDQSAALAGADSVAYAVSLNNLARTLYQLERFADAGALFERATAIFEKRQRTDHPDYCSVLSNLALAQLELQQPASARAYAARGVAACERRLGPTHPDLVEPLNALGRAAMGSGDVVAAAAAFRRALDIAERAYGRDHPAAALALHNLGGVLFAAGDAVASALLRRSAAIAERAGSGLDALRATTLEVLALTQLKSGQTAQALADMRRSSLLTRERLERALPRRGGGPGSAWADLRKRFAFHATVALQAATKAPQADLARLHDESYVAAELARGSSAARAIAQMAARFASADGALAKVVRERQDAVEQWQLLERRQILALVQPAAGQAGAGPAAAASLRNERAALAERIAAIDRRLTADFPAYVELANPEPPSVALTRALLRPGEGLVAYLVREDETLIWFLDATTLIVRRQPIGYAALAELVGRLRVSLEPDSRGRVPAFDAAASAQLYRQLIDPLGGALARTQHLFVVDDGPLRSIPFAVLAPGGSANPGTDPGSLIVNHALTTLPSVSALRALRRFARPARAPSAFAGFGDPVFSGTPDKAMAGRASRRWRDGHIDLETLQSLPRLPESADELRSIARMLGGGDVFLAERANEAQVKRLDLSRYRIIAFATHSFDMAEADDGSAEPGLALTPPPAQTNEDDGLLTVSEVAQLRLDAELVILSACSTAGPDGSSGGEALSGLARAFIFAGSRALLVSHWPIESNAAVRLTTGMIEALRRDQKIGRAEALRRTMLALAQGPNNGHPFFWAPFVLVGEGGLVRSP